MNDNYISHHGILNQKWGVRNGPPYPLTGGAYSPAEKKAIYKQRVSKKNSIYNKKHFDEVLSKDKTTLTTLSYDANRTKDTDMFFAAHDKFDKHQYNALFNKPVKDVATGDTVLKFRINNSLKSDIKVASEDSSIKVFNELYSKDRDFYNFVTDQSRMQSYFVKDKYKFKGYRESKKVLDKLKNPDYKPTEKEVGTLYRMFNYTIPFDGAGDARAGKDAKNQRSKFFDAMKKEGYGAVLDTNDAIYGAFKAKSPVIVFDMSQIVPKNTYRTKASSKYISKMALATRRMLGV